ncbi:zf-C3Hc3H domain-containing protein [Cephalotus follicularis]|uniref:KAT8 regulatory NSL complex subunit 2 n=1 Tax=Cephalotus follicularis TaxID=3775 RepID=A0A1Q3BPV7_CEPFO|nr:zf-C3Hc3H domain-containing protein [Cephalotus follicularis]
MASAPKHQHHNPSTSKPPKNPNPTTNDSQNLTTTTTTTISTPITLSQQDIALSRATHLTRPELLKRRSSLKQLSKCYRDHYWALMEDLKIQFRDYYWKYGVSPFKDDPQQNQVQQQKDINSTNSNVPMIEGCGENNNSNNNNHRCLFVGCKLKAMALTSFCHLHILSDGKQKLYKPCNYVIKSAHAGPITCGKPILTSTVPSLCSVHFQKAQKHVTRALKNAGLNVSSSSKVTPKFHVVVTEYVRQIQMKRRAARKGNGSKLMGREEHTG